MNREAPFRYSGIIGEANDVKLANAAGGDRKHAVVRSLMEDVKPGRKWTYRSDKRRIVRVVRVEGWSVTFRILARSARPNSRADSKGELKTISVYGFLQSYRPL
jgi:hypothetical protein